MEKLRIGSQIREFRKKRQISGKDFAKLTGFSPAAISKFERGILRPTEEFIEKAIVTLKLSPEEAGLLRELKALFDSRYKRWNTSGNDVKQNQDFASERESNASVIRSYFNQMIPGLLQSESYMRAVLPGFTAVDDDFEAIVKARKKRQKILGRSSRSFVFVLGEAALRICVKSRAVMSDQLRHLISTMNKCPGLELRILPFSTELAVIPISHFVIYDERTVEIEVGRGQIDLWTEDEVQYHINLMNYLTSTSLSPSQSKKFISTVLTAYSEQPKNLQ